MVLAEKTLTHFRKNRHIVPIQDICVGLNDILRRHARFGQHGENVCHTNLVYAAIPSGTSPSGATPI